MIDSSYEYEYVDSDEEHHEKQEYDTVPHDTSYKFKYKTIDGKTYQGFEYLLRKDKVLPATSVLKGCIFSDRCYLNNLRLKVREYCSAKRCHLPSRV